MLINQSLGKNILLDLKPILKNLKNDQERLMLLSALGFYVSDKDSLEKLASLEEIIASDFFKQKLLSFFAKKPDLQKIFLNLRRDLDLFYEEGGFLWDFSEHKKISAIKKAPLIFFGRDNSSLLEKKPSVAIVGSRNADAQGLAWANKLAYDLSKMGFLIISGGALGVDLAAHQGAIKAQGPSLFVLGLAAKLRSNFVHSHLNGIDFKPHCILHPFGPFDPQGKFMFVERNRYLVALAEALVVVQGQEGSGTLHTARFAHNLGVPIFVKAHGENNALSFVPKFLLKRKKAQEIDDAEALIDFLASKKTKPKAAINTAIIEPKEPLPALLEFIKNNNNQALMEEMMAFSGRSFLSIQEELFNYELAGQLRRHGAQFVLTGL